MASTDIKISNPGVEGVAVIDGLFSEEECRSIIDLAHTYRFADLSPQHIVESYECQRVVLSGDDAVRISELLKSRVLPHVRPIEGKIPLRMNTFVRVLKMTKGEGLFSHTDGAYVASRSTEPDRPELWGQRSLLSLILYLQGDGGTHFDKENVSVPNAPGRVVLFPHTLVHHSIHHSSDTVRYVLRSDVIFTK
eukprot:Sspe_Gene.116567::Locus_105985_Transcript_1_1_Confidence_1.000_Length_832::g.116567::m.116567